MDLTTAYYETLNFTRPGGSTDRGDTGGRCGDLGGVTQVPGRYGDTADLHVYLEHVWRPDPDAGAGDLPDQAEASSAPAKQGLGAQRWRCRLYRSGCGCWRQ